MQPAVVVMIEQSDLRAAVVAELAAHGIEAWIRSCACLAVHPEALGDFDAAVIDVAGPQCPEVVARLALDVPHLPCVVLVRPDDPYPIGVDAVLRLPVAEGEVASMVRRVVRASAATAESSCG